MKKLLHDNILSLLILFTLSGLNAQSTAFDWTRTACSTTESVNLFNELDAGKVVVLDFVMVPNCGWCIWASRYLKNVVEPFEQSHPDRVKVYTIGFQNSYTCQQLLDWKNQFNLHADAVFCGDSTEMDYYGGMGMPTVVVAGGSSHQVFYNHQGLLESDTAGVSAAIQEALLSVSAVDSPIDLIGKALLVSPNPASGEVMVRFDNSSQHDLNIAIELLDYNGRILSAVNPGIDGSARFSTESLAAGVYFVRYHTSEQVMFKKLIVCH
jgi:hypothetical protein